MPLERAKVLQKSRPSEQDFRDALAADWSRVFPPSLRRTAAEALGCSKGTVDNGASGSNAPQAYTLLCSLMADPTALMRTLALFGMKAVPTVAEAANDLSTISGISHLTSTWADALSDGYRDHRETMALADEIRPLIAALSAIVVEADRIRGLAA